MFDMIKEKYVVLCKWIKNKILNVFVCNYLLFFFINKNVFIGFYEFYLFIFYGLKWNIDYY